VLFCLHAPPRASHAPHVVDANISGARFYLFRSGRRNQFVLRRKRGRILCGGRVFVASSSCYVYICLSVRSIKNGALCAKTLIDAGCRRNARHSDLVLNVAQGGRQTNPFRGRKNPTSAHPQLTCLSTKKQRHYLQHTVQQVRSFHRCITDTALILAHHCQNQRHT